MPLDASYDDVPFVIIDRWRGDFKSTCTLFGDDERYFRYCRDDAVGRVPQRFFVDSESMKNPVGSRVDGHRVVRLDSWLCQVLGVGSS